MVENMVDIENEKRSLGGFVADDIVQISPTPTKDGWVRQMNDTIGKIGRVIVIGPHSILVSFPESSTLWWYMPQDLIKIG
jgi:hypothetical protein